MQQQFDNTLQSLLPAEDRKYRILLAISGGMDSMCMLYLFLNSSLKNEIGIAHVNFSLRDQDCDLDQQMVEQYAKQNNTPFHTIRFDTKKYAKENSLSTQMAARDLRYDWFYKIQKEFGYDFIAIAHNSDDSVETLFLNILRGTGIKGLTGIKLKTGDVIRPILPFLRKEIESFVTEHNVPYREDYTNAESHYSRNRLRNVVFPEFKKINPSFTSTVYRSIGKFTEGEEILDDLFEKKRDILYKYDGNGVEINIFQLKKEKGIAYWLYKIVDRFGFNSFQVNQIALALDGRSGKIFQSPTHELLIDRERIKVYERVEKDHSFVIEEPGLYLFNNREFKVDIYLKPDRFRPKPLEGQLFIDAERVKFPIYCRCWMAADRFRPFGMKGFKKLSDFFIDLKMDKQSKENQIILTNRKREEREEIFCIAGLRIDDRYKITNKTKIILEISVF